MFDFLKDVVVYVFVEVVAFEGDSLFKLFVVVNIVAATVSFKFVSVFFKGFDGLFSPVHWYLLDDFIIHNIVYNVNIKYIKIHNLISGKDDGKKVKEI